MSEIFQEREAGVGEAGRARDRESTQKEVNKLRGSIQTLTRSANPLGKLMDFLQEDVDSMQVRNKVQARTQFLNFSHLRENLISGGKRTKPYS